MAKPITPKQIAFIEDLVAQKLGADLAETGLTVPEWMEANGIDALTVQGASKLIETLKAMPNGSVEQAQAAQAAEGGDPAAAFLAVAEKVITNRRGGTCAVCQTWVEVGEGLAVLNERLKWDTLHGRTADACPVAPAAPSEPVPQSAWEVLQTLTPGCYAIPSLTGNNDLDFFEIKVNRGFHNPEKKGQKYLVRHVGGRETVYVSRAEQPRVIEALAALDEDGVRAAQILFGQTIGHCGRCGRTLTDETSRQFGIGPECRSKGGF